ncbi:MAG: DsbA family protein [Parvularculaceae bacterium]
MAILDVYWSFRSPYSYLAADRLIMMGAAYAIDLRFRPVRPLALRESDFFERGRPQFLPYLLKDVMREAERLSIPIAMPRPDPVAMNMETGVVDAEQPLMDRLMTLGVAAVETGRGLFFARSVSKRIWGGRENWHEPATLAEAAEEAGLALDALETWARDNPGRVAEAIAENEAEQLKHHWGVPLMVLDGEPFFGQDRLDALRWRLDQLVSRQS